MNKNVGVLLGGLCVMGIAYVILSSPDCKKACRSVFQPLATKGGQMALSGALGVLGMTAFAKMVA